MSREPAGWDPVSGWDDDPAGAGPGWLPPQAGDGADAGVRPRRAARLGLAAAVVVAVAVVLVWPGLATDQEDRPAAPAARPPAAPAPPAARTAYAFARPGGWRDATGVLAPRFPGARPEVVLVGTATAGLTASLSVVRTRAGPGRTSLALLPAAALRQLRLPGARLVGAARRLALDGEPAIAADYRLPRGGGQLRARQVACYHRGDLYLVTLTAEATSFPSQSSAQDRVLRSWRWT